MMEIDMSETSEIWNDAIRDAKFLTAFKKTIKEDYYAPLWDDEQCKGVTVKYGRNSIKVELDVIRYGDFFEGHPVFMGCRLEVNEPVRAHLSEVTPAVIRHKYPVPVCTDELYAHLKRVCMYLGDDEQNDFEQNFDVDTEAIDFRFRDTGMQKDHIYYSVKRIEQFLEQP